jgi:hypothetical protein
MNTTIMIKRIATFVGFSLGAFALAAVAAEWVPPAGDAPTNNVEAPINASSDTQDKHGKLRVNTLLTDTNGLDVFGVARLFGGVEIGSSGFPASLTLLDGNQGAGKVLTSDANGKAKWSSPAAANLNIQQVWGTSSATNGDVSSAPCPTGTKLVGGGFEAVGTGSGTERAVRYNGPGNNVSGTQDTNTWYAQEAGFKIKAVALCIS